MKQFILYSCGIAMLASAGCGDDVEQPATAAATPAPAEATPVEPVPAGSLGLIPTVVGVDGGPQIAFRSAEYDFGEVSDRGKMSAKIPFTNTGSQPLTILDVKSTCGCTAASLAKRQFQPGEGADIDITFDPAGRADRIRKVVKVTTNASPSPIDVTIHATVRPLMRLTEHLLKMEVLPRGRAHTRRFDVLFTDPELSITRLEAEHPQISARVVETADAGSTLVGLPEYRSTIEVTIAADAPWGLLDPGTLYLTARGRPWPEAESYQATYRMFVSGQIYGELTPEPIALVTRGVTRPGGNLEMSLVLTRTTGEPFEVTSAVVTSSNQPGISVAWERESANAWRISARGRATITGAIKGVITLQTDVPGEEEIAVTLSAYVK